MYSAQDIQTLAKLAAEELLSNHERPERLLNRPRVAWAATPEALSAAIYDILADQKQSYGFISFLDDLVLLAPDHKLLFEFKHTGDCVVSNSADCKKRYETLRAADKKLRDGLEDQPIINTQSPLLMQDGPASTLASPHAACPQDLIDAIKTFPDNDAILDKLEDIAVHALKKHAADFSAIGLIGKRELADHLHAILNDQQTEVLFSLNDNSDRRIKAMVYHHDSQTTLVFGPAISSGYVWGTAYRSCDATKYASSAHQFEARVNKSSLRKANLIPIMLGRNGIRTITGGLPALQTVIDAFLRNEINPLTAPSKNQKPAATSLKVS